ncbi:hypothetical protein BIV57_19310 [Mangrovactinospora gilvigrisea]|uniref:N-acetyltransferase domain-containing protein n=1 Tax=Mangrovactinospora gilvigrisea TaxID=1428644 RepID=A0A1J7BB37_9ACTN|nr:GNAT family N-acetyltransferase [Mangrovactinospora gilvigrisea]OIV35867.1 hypothetical protein BIV57_19310 [Mangrovactinospora gilvigrisea]
MLTLAPWDPARADEVRRLLGPAPDHGVSFGRGLCRPDSDGSGPRPFGRARLLLDGDGAPVGVAAVRENPGHPSRLRAYVEIRPDHRRRGLGTAALAALGRLAAAEDGRRLHVRCVRGTAGHRFTEASGGVEIQRARELRLRPADLGPPPGGWSVSRQLVGPGTHIPEDCVRAYRDSFAAGHRDWNPARERTVEDCRRDFFTDIPAVFLAVRRPGDGSVAGVAFVDPPGLDGELFGPDTGFSGWPTDLDDPDGPAIVAALLAAAAREAPDGELVAEVDDAFRATAAVVDPIVREVLLDLVHAQL